MHVLPHGARISYVDIGTGTGPAILLIHGLGGSWQAWLENICSLARDHRVIAVDLPGFGASPIDRETVTIAAYARSLDELCQALELTTYVAVGSSLGGWIAAELALAGSGRITSLILVDAVGIEVAGHPVADFFSLTLDQVAGLSYHNPGRYRIDPAAMSDGERAVMAGNRAALATYAGIAMADPGLRARLGQISMPALVLWGDSDQIADSGYGQAYAAAIPGARFRILPGTGHVPQIETPDQLLSAITGFARDSAASQART